MGPKDRDKIPMNPNFSIEKRKTKKIFEQNGLIFKFAGFEKILFFARMAVSPLPCKMLAILFGIKNCVCF